MRERRGAGTGRVAGEYEEIHGDIDCRGSRGWRGLKFRMASRQAGRQAGIQAGGRAGKGGQNKIYMNRTGSNKYFTGTLAIKLNPQCSLFKSWWLSVIYSEPRDCMYLTTLHVQGSNNVLVFSLVT